MLRTRNPFSTLEIHFWNAAINFLSGINSLWTSSSRFLTLLVVGAGLGFLMGLIFGLVNTYLGL